MSADYGTDIGCFPDLDTSFATVSGQRALAEQILRSITTDGLFYDPAFGRDIRRYLNADLPNLPNLLSQIAKEVETQAARDERVDSADVAATYDVASQTLKLTITVAGADGPFQFVVGVSSVTATLLSLG